MTRLLGNAVGWRTGVAMSVDEVPRTPADPPVVQFSALDAPSTRSAPAGGAGRDEAAARAAAIGELLERYAAARALLPTRARADLLRGERRLAITAYTPAQQAQPGFPYADAYGRDAFVRVFDLLTNEPVWAPEVLVSTAAAAGGLATSSGLAAHPLVTVALLRAVQELVERDALMVAWLHGIGAPRRPLTDVVRSLAEPIDAEVGLFDLTPAYSPHPVAVVAGSAFVDGRRRCAFGLACRTRWADAVEKAALEWAQGLVFAGVTTGFDTADDVAMTPADVTDFDAHAVFYTRRPDLWEQLPWWRGAPAAAAPVQAAAGRPVDELDALVHALTAHGVELFYRDLTLPDTAACGVRVVRVLSPQLAGIHGDHRWPQLGGTAADLAQRFPTAATLTRFPSPYPHPLG